MNASRCLAGLLLLCACSEQTLTPPPPPPPSSQCVFPRACYLRDCDDCSGGPGRCRRVLGGCGADMGPISGCAEAPKPTDPAVTCPLPDAGVPMVCAVPEAVCVARGPRCGGYCVRATEMCDSGTPLPPQRSDRDGGGTFCPYSDDRCCETPRDQGGDGQGGEDMAVPVPDGAGADAAGRG